MYGDNYGVAEEGSQSVSRSDLWPQLFSPSNFDFHARLPNCLDRHTAEILMRRNGFAVYLVGCAFKVSNGPSESKAER